MDGLDLSIKNILLIRSISKIRNRSNHQEYNIIIRSIRHIRNANTMRDTLAFSFIADTIQNTQ